MTEDIKEVLLVQEKYMPILLKQSTKLNPNQAIKLMTTLKLFSLKNYHEVYEMIENCYLENEQKMDIK